MPAITEIYVCRNQERLSQGALQYSAEIRDRAQAVEDAMMLCARDAAIRRITYYMIDDAGRPRLMLSYANPGYVERPRRAAARADGPSGAWPPRRRASHRRRQARVPAVFSRAYAWLNGLFAAA